MNRTTFYSVLGFSVLGFGFETHAKPELWLRFAHISDTQICDEESPARAVRSENLIDAAWRPHEAFGAQTLDATLRVLRAHHDGTLQPKMPLDLIIQTGDAVDNSQFNEVLWFIQAMDGASQITPDSGERDGVHRPVDPAINPKLSFRASGSGTIPWYTVFGNHDALAVGNFTIDQSDTENPHHWYSPVSELVAKALGLDKIGRKSLLPTDYQSPAVLLGSREFLLPQTQKLDWDQVRPGTIVADMSRHFVSRLQFMSYHFPPFSNSQPPGHGFTEENLRNQTTWYSVRPKAQVPIRFIAVDSVNHDAGRMEFGYEGRISKRQFETFIKPEIEKAASKGEYVILFSHHPSSDFGFFDGKNISTRTWRRYLSKQKHVLAHFCGHTHRNHYQFIKEGPFGYAEIETSSILDYPQEARIVEFFFDPATEEVSLNSFLTSHLSQPTPLSLESFRRAKEDYQTFSGTRQYRAQEENGFLFQLGQTDEMPSFRPWNNYAFTSDGVFGAKKDRHISLRFKR